jgi:hypothetical protein
MKHGKQILAVVIFLCMSLFAFSQEITSEKQSRVKASDSVQVAKHSPTAAMLWSIIPGGGQIYNKKYWKVPIVYGLLEGSCYFLTKYASDMMLYRREFINRRDGNTELLIPGLADIPDENILFAKQKAQRNMEICIAATAIIYTLNFIDAMVDAHLYYFDVSDDLSLHWSPMLLPNPINTSPSYGVSLVLSF